MEVYIMKAGSMQVRIITTVNGDGAEQVIFTEDFESSPHDYVTPGYHLTADDFCECELPTVFPLECTLQRKLI
jgi:hypothetical protein